MVSDSGVPMLMDFGISHMLMATATLETATKAGKGTARWQAPELLFEIGTTADHHTKKSDIWALGMVYLVSFFISVLSRMT